MMEINKIYNEDCLSLMDKMKEEGESVDLILTSPPYNTSRKGSSLDNACANIRYDDFDDCRTNEEYINWTVDIFNHFDKVLRKDRCVLYNVSYSSENTECMWLTIADIIRNTNFTIADCIVWKKPSTSPNSCSSNKLTRITEYVLVFCRKNEFHTFECNKQVSSFRNTGQKSYENIFNLIEAPCNDGSCDIHKATFSTMLVRKLLRIYCKEKWIVYDPFIGTGTTAVGCVKENKGIQFIGSEISKRYCEYAEKRIKKEIQQLTLF